VSVVDSAAEKIARGREHIAELTAEINGFLATKPYAVDRQVELGGRVHLYVVSRDTPAPKSIGLLIGDAAHNLRSALDHLAVACANRGAGRELTDTEERRIEYPIRLTPEEFDKALKDHKLDFIEAGPLEIIRRYQPYRQHPTNPDFAMSWRLNILDNIDKHRRIATTTSVVTIPIDGSRFVSSGAAPRVEVPREGWGLGSVVSRLVFDEPLPDAPLAWVPEFSITIDGDGPSTRRPDEVLEQCAVWIETFIMGQIAQWEAGCLTVRGAP